MLGGKVTRTYLAHHELESVVIITIIINTIITIIVTIIVGGKATQKICNSCWQVCVDYHLLCCRKGFGQGPRKGTCWKRCSINYHSRSRVYKAAVEKSDWNICQSS